VSVRVGEAASAPTFAVAAKSLMGNDQLRQNVRKATEVIDIAHYLPLDGTVFHDSRSVGSEPFIGMATLGVCVRHQSLALSLAGTFFTKTFEAERNRSEFGTFSVSWYF
jgi:hypothetical protein